MNKLLICFTLTALLITSSIRAQLGIGPNITQVDQSAMLEVRSNIRGFLGPRMSATQRLAIPAPANGLLVYDNDSSAYMLFAGGSWTRLLFSKEDLVWKRNGVSIYSNNTGYAGIGTINPSGKLEIEHQSAPDAPTLKLTERSNDGFVRIELKNKNAPASFIVGSRNTTEQITDILGFYHSSSPDAIFQINGEGNMGIGRAPSGGILKSRLSVDGGSLQGALYASAASGSILLPAVVGEDKNTALNNGVGVGAVSTNGIGLLASSGGRAIITAGGGKSGFGVLNPVEMVEVNGAVKIGNTTTTNEGTLRYTGTDFQGYTGGQWRSLIGGTVASQWIQNGNNLTNANTGNVGIGANPAADSKLDVSSSLAKTINATNSGATGFAVAGTSATGVGGRFETVTGAAIFANVTNPAGTGVIVIGGKSGFGILNPTEQLDVNGGVRVGNSTGTNAGTIRYNGTDLQGYVAGAWKSLTGAGIGNYWLANGNDVYNANSGNIGINTTTPSAKLDVRSIALGATAIAGQATLFGSKGISGTGISGAYAGYFKASPANIGTATSIYTSTTTTGGTALLADTGNVQLNFGRLRVVRGDVWVDSGKVGVGTVLPEAKLHVKASNIGETSIKTEATLFGSSAISANGYIGATAGYFRSTPANIGTVSAIIATSANGHNAIYTDSGNVLVNRGKLRVVRGDMIADSGRLGVGVSAPLAKVDIAFNSNVNEPQLRLLETADDFARLNFQNSTQSFWSIAGYNNATNANERLNFYNSTSGNLLSLTGNGNLGIGTTSPTAKLEVAGQVKITGGVPGAGKVLTSDAAGLASWQTPSAGGFTLPYSGSATSANALISIVNNGTGVGINSVTGAGDAVSGSTTAGVAIRGSASTSGTGVYGASNTGTAGLFVTTAGTALQALGAVKLGVPGAAAGKYLKATDANGNAEWADAPAGGGSGPWAINGNNINNTNTGAVLLAAANGASGAKMEIAADNPFGKVASIYNTNASYMTILEVKETGSSGSPAGCVGCSGNTAIKSSANFGDALFATSNSRGIFLKAGSGFYPAMKIEINAAATTALEMDGQIKINGGNPGAGKVLTSDENGLASWQTPSGGGGGASGWGLSGNSGITASNFIGTTTNADVIFKQNNVEGLRVKTGGALLATGNESTGVTPVSGAGSRMMWIPAKAAFRAGNVSNGAIINFWDDANIGYGSMAGGINNKVTGNGSFAMGSNNAENTAGHFSNALFGSSNTISNSSASLVVGQLNTITGSVNAAAIGQSHSVTGLLGIAMGNSHTVGGQYATAIGNTNIANGYASLAMGDHTNASGQIAVAIGNQSVASGSGSFALGSFTNTNSKAGAWCIGDFVVGSSTLNASTDNTLNARFKNGYYLYTNSTLSVGAFLGPNQTTWDFISDSTKKEKLLPVNGEEFLTRIAAFKLSSWNYKGQDSKTYRHYGPMAQDFHKAFGQDAYGTVGSDTTINSGDFAGVSFIAIQALEKRTAVLTAESKKLQAENSKLKEQNDLLALELAAIKKQMNEQAEILAVKLKQIEKLVLAAPTAAK